MSTVLNLPSGMTLANVKGAIGHSRTDQYQAKCLSKVILYLPDSADFYAQVTVKARFMTTRAATISEIVTSDYRAARVLEAYGIDFCFSGDKTLKEVSEELHLNNAALEKSVEDLKVQPNGCPVHWKFTEWETRFLVDYIIQTHHNYMRRSIPELLRLGHNVSTMASDDFPETKEINRLVIEIAGRARQHLTSEEYALFPYILEMEMVRDSKLPFNASKFGGVETPIHTIESEHKVCIGLLKSIRSLSNKYIAPDSASNDHRYWYQLLQEFDADTHLHIHLEDNILFPRALALENDLIHRMESTSSA